MKKKYYLIIAIATLIIVSLSISYFYCNVNPQGEIKVGAILPLTGPSALLGELSRNGLSLAEDKINNSGGIKGRNIKVIYEDGLADPNTSLSAFKKLVYIDKVKFVFTTHSSVGLALSPLADENKVLLFVHASHPQITGKSIYVFRHSNVAEQESQEIVEFVKKQRKIIPAMAVMNDDYGIVFQQKIKKILSENNISIANDVTYDTAETDFKTVAQKLLSNRKPDLIVIAGLGNGVGLLIRRIKEYGYKGDILITLGAVITGAFESAGESAKGINYIDFNFDEKDKNYKRLVDQYYEKYHSKLQSSSILVYNTLLLLGYVIEKVDVDTHEVSKYLKNINQYKGVGEKMSIVNNYDIVPALQILRK